MAKDARNRSIPAQAIGACETPLIILDRAGRIEHCSAGAAAMFGTETGTLIGAPLSQFVTEPALTAEGWPEAWKVAARSPIHFRTQGADAIACTGRLAALGGSFESPECAGALFEFERSPDLAGGIPRILDQALHASMTGIWLWEPSTDVLRQFGYWPERWRRNPDGTRRQTGQAMFEVMHPEDVAQTRDALMAHLRGATGTYEGRHRVLNTVGEYEYVQSRGQVIERDEGGRASLVLGAYTDIRELDLQSRRLDSMLAGSGQAIWEYETANDLLTGRGFEQLPGLGEVARLPMTAEALLTRIDPDEAKAVRASLHALLRGEAAMFETRTTLTSSDGRLLHFLLRASVVQRDAAGRVERLYGTCTNITDLVASDELNRIALENGRQGTWVWYPHQDEIDLSPHWYALMGYPEGYFRQVQDAFNSIIHPDDIERVAAALAPMLDGKREDFEVDMRLRNHAGEYVWMLSRGRCLARNEARRAVSVVGSHADITETKQRQNQLNVIAEAMTSGEEKRLLNALTKAAAELTNMQVAAITLLNGDGTGTVTATYPRDSGLVGYTYKIATSPCSFSLDHDTQIITAGAARQFPDEPAVAAAGVEAYVGRRLLDGEGNTRAIFALMDSRPITDDRDILSVLELFAMRASTELQREQVYNRLSQQESRLQAALEGAAQTIWEWDADTDRYTVYEPTSEQFERTASSGLERMRLIHPDDVQRVADARHDYFSDRAPLYEYEARSLDPQGNYRWILCRGKASERDESGRVLRLMGTHTDITAVKAAQEQHAASRRFLELILDTVPQYVFWKDQESVYRGGNTGFAELSGHPAPGYLVGKRDDDFWWRSQAHLFADRDRDLLEGRVPRIRLEREIEMPDGARQWFECTRVPMRDPDGRISGILGAMQNITERKLAEDEAQRLALFDPLTELPNRRYLIDRLETTIASAERHGGFGALLFIDLDQFKQINDTVGHSVGDQLLSIVARRLHKVTRLEDTVARLGGDEFVVLLPSLDRGKRPAALQSELAAEKISEVLTEPYVIDGQVFHVTPTIGIAMFPEPGKSVDDVLKEADTAMYSGKADGRNAIRFFHSGMEESARNQLQLERDLRAALGTEALDLHYQPQVDSNGRIIGAEALLRWTSAERGAVSPADFIPVAEERGVIIELGRWVIDRALATLCQWDSKPGPRLPLLSINVSSRQFRDRDFVRDLGERLRSFGVSPERLLLEITESTVMDNVEETVRRMEQLRDIGVRFGVDDFGIGYSSLSQIKRLPIDQLKIDRSFIDDIGRDPNDEVICRTIIAMGDSLGLHTIAEGVESTEQLEFLRARGCDGFQGYLFLRPSPADAFWHFCQQREVVGYGPAPVTISAVGRS